MHGGAIPRSASALLADEAPRAGLQEAELPGATAAAAAAVKRGGATDIPLDEELR